MKAIVLTIALAAAATMAHAEEEIYPVVTPKAQFADGVTLKGYCTGNREAAKAYVAGWHDKRYVDTMFTEFPASKLPDEIMVQNAYGAVAGRFCLPKGVTLDQLTDAVCAYVDANPKKKAYAGVGQVEGALQEAYPCPEE